MGATLAGSSKPDVSSNAQELTPTVDKDDVKSQPYGVLLRQRAEGRDPFTDINYGDDYLPRTPYTEPAPADAARFTRWLTIKPPSSNSESVTPWLRVDHARCRPAAEHCLLDVTDLPSILGCPWLKAPLYEHVPTNGS